MTLSSARRGWVWVLLATAVAVGCGGSEPLDGSYVADEQPSLTLTLEESDDGAITGTLAEPGASLPLVARRDADGFSGAIGPSGEVFPLRAIAQDEQLVLEIGDVDEVQRLTFRRRGDAGPAAPVAAPGAPVAAFAPPAAAGQRRVVINEQRLDDEELARIEATYQIRIPDAEYWYDPVLGAWGPKGGPTMGFIPAGLALGGALRPDASGGGTRVFVNGRELHAYDLLALQRITGPIVPGRYFITSEGIAGVAGGSPQWNLAAMGGQAPGGAGAGDNPSNTWQSSVTGASGFSDGETGAVFLPGVGIVSYGN